MGMMGIFDPACCKQAEECLARGLVVEAARILLPHKPQGHRRVLELLHEAARRAMGDNRLAPSWQKDFQALEHFLRFRMGRLREFPGAYGQELVNELRAQLTGPLPGTYRRVWPDFGSESVLAGRPWNS